MATRFAQPLLDSFIPAMNYITVGMFGPLAEVKYLLTIQWRTSWPSSDWYKELTAQWYFETIDGFELHQPSSYFCQDNTLSSAEYSALSWSHPWRLVKASIQSSAEVTSSQLENCCSPLSPLELQKNKKWRMLFALQNQRLVVNLTQCSGSGKHRSAWSTSPQLDRTCWVRLRNQV